MTRTAAGSYAVLAGVTFVGESPTSAVVAMRSQYDTLGIGCAMDPREVDVAGHLFWHDLLLSTFEYRFYLKYVVEAKDFLEKQIYAPYGAYSIPRRTRSGMGFTIGPMPRGDVITVLDKTNVTKPQNLALRRTITRFFYNTIIWQFDKNPLTDAYDAARADALYEAARDAGMTEEE